MKLDPEALWLEASRIADPVSSPEYERLLLRAGQLGSVEARRALGVACATGDWTGPRNLAEAARWYRLAAENGHAESQYDLGIMILLGQGEPKNIDEGLEWLTRAGEQGDWVAVRALADCYESGLHGVPVDAGQAAVWRGKWQEYRQLNPPEPMLRYSLARPADESSISFLHDVEGITGFSLPPRGGGVTEVCVCYDPAVIGPDAVDRHLLAAGISAVRHEPD